MGDPNKTPTKDKSDKAREKKTPKTPDPPTKVRDWFGVIGDHGSVGWIRSVQGSDHDTALFSLRSIYIFLYFKYSVSVVGLSKVIDRTDPSLVLDQTIAGTVGHRTVIQPDERFHRSLIGVNSGSGYTVDRRAVGQPHE